MASTTRKANEEWTRRNAIGEDQRIRAERNLNNTKYAQANRDYETAVGLENLRHDNGVSLSREVMRRGRMGGPGTPGDRATSVSPGAITPRNQTYRQRNPTGTNDMEYAGQMHRGSLALEKEQEGSPAYKSAVKDILDAYNGGTWSSRNDASGLIPSQDGKGFHLLDAKGDLINAKPVTIKDLQNVSGNVLTGQLVHQRNTNNPSLGLPASNTQNLNTAQINARSGIDKERLGFMADEITQLRAGLLPGDTDREELIKTKTREYVKMSNALRNDVGGKQQPTGMTPREEVQTMIDESRDDSYIRRVMWSKYGNDQIMGALEESLKGRKEQGVNPTTGRAYQQQYKQIEQGGLDPRNNVVDINVNKVPEQEIVPRGLPQPGLPQPNSGRNKTARKRKVDRLGMEMKPGSVPTTPNKNRNVRSRGKTTQPGRLQQETLAMALAGEMTKEDLNTFLLQNANNLDAADLNKLIMMLR